LPNFKLFTRIIASAKCRKLARWNQHFIEEQFSKQTQQIERVWVCGTPQLSEVFEKAYKNICAGDFFYGPTLNLTVSKTQLFVI
jgi:hypothetical protein